MAGQHGEIWQAADVHVVFVLKILHLHSWHPFETAQNLAKTCGRNGPFRKVLYLLLVCAFPQFVF